MKRKITSNNILETSVEIYNSLPINDVNKEFAYKKMIELLNFRINYSKGKEDLIRLLKIFSERTIEHSMIIKKLASYYKKPFWMFW